MLRLLFALSICFVSITGYTQKVATGFSEKLDRSADGYELSAASLPDAIISASAHFQVPVGIEWTPSARTLSPFHQSWKNKTVNEVFHDIVSAYPDYAVKTDNGRVHVYSRGFERDPSNFLNIKIPDSFAIRHETIALANADLLTLIQSVVSPHPARAGGGIGSSIASGNLHEQPLDLVTRGLTVRDALDKLVGISERKVWVATFENSAALTSTGFHRTETLWHLSPSVNRDEPVWDLLEWDTAKRVQWPRDYDRP